MEISFERLQKITCPYCNAPIKKEKLKEKLIECDYCGNTLNQDNHLFYVNPNSKDHLSEVNFLIKEWLEYSAFEKARKMIKRIDEIYEDIKRR